MTYKLENPFELSTCGETAPVSSCEFGMNDSGTCEKIDTRLTQRRSRAVPADPTAQMARAVAREKLRQKRLREREARGD